MIELGLDKLIRGVNKSGKFWVKLICIKLGDKMCYDGSSKRIWKGLILYDIEVFV